MTQQERITKLNNLPSRKEGEYVLYWMHASIRTIENPALEFAVERANAAGVPVIVMFCLIDKFPQSGKRSYRFMLEGLKEVEASLAERNIKFVLKKDKPTAAIPKYCSEAESLIFDRGYAYTENKWESVITRRCKCPVFEVDANVIVPVETASNKREYSAATLRRKIVPIAKNFIAPCGKNEAVKSSLETDIQSDEFSIHDARPDLREAAGFNYTGHLLHPGGQRSAEKMLAEFIEHRLENYENNRNDPAEDFQSGLSPYLRFGQISPALIYRRVKESGKPCDAFLEQLLVRRELAFNFVWFTENFWRYSALPAWARETLEEQKSAKREYVYKYEELEKARTHDKYWNAAQKEMAITGKMHGYMRMYWGKKILEWTNNPKTAFDWALRLNNVYSLDGNDPNSFAGVAWCFGNHDRPWTKRKIFGSVRYMNDRGLERKFNMKSYISRVNELLAK
ncbi:Deoxyribodipyrimidine photo-lyase [Sedimentisphaera cyanobacteriorum]|uniref:Deoxyribodipyrimidine photo-lyase n=1 Tax=Sedimentisphaera cyanobacteriorum TaxID=1940790 RepID=A0A1Q2HM96_9BACT|nr:deoxyribodipyrimidine photo-lyase [Sedimentisphaera cyanobacteriorum]AQQ08649.1 Deoxyribodipyrimidine photo-lyase [Sedimentisphaera cyanobacteriorum]